MGYAVTGLEGTITSWGSGASDWHNHIIATGTAPTTVKVAVTADEIETTAVGATVDRAFRPGLYSWTVSGESLWPRSSRYIGAQGLVTFASGYVLRCKEWTMNMAWNALETTQFNAAGITFRSYRPQIRGKYSGTFKGQFDSGTAISLPQAWTASSAAATFKLSEDGTNDNKFTANIVARQLNHDINIASGAIQEYSYAYTVDGAVTCLSSTGDGASTYGTNVLPGSTTGVALTYPPYDNAGDGAPNKTLLITAATGRTYSGTAFLTNVNVTCPVDGLIKVQWTAQGTGALTVA